MHTVESLRDDEVVDIKGFTVKLIFEEKRLNDDAKVIALEYDPNRTAHLALLEYADGEKTYILAPSLLYVGDILVSSNEKVDFKPWQCITT